MDKPIFEITRSYSRKVQLEQYEPADYFCSAKEVFYEMPDEEVKKAKSEELWKFCKNEVEKAILDDITTLEELKRLDMVEREDAKNAKSIKLEKKEKSADEELDLGI